MLQNLREIVLSIKYSGLIFSSKQNRTPSLGKERPLHAEHDRTLWRHSFKMLFHT